MSATIEIKVPDIGDFKDVAVIEIHTGAGKRVSVNDTLIVLESDKAAIDVPAPISGLVKTIALKIGDKVSQGSNILLLEADVAAETPSPELPQPKPEPPAAPSPITPAPALFTADPAPAPANDSAPHASPSVRQYARELGVDLAKLRGSGPKGRIQREDVAGYVKAALAAPSSGAATGLNLLPWPEIDFSKFGEIERVSLSNIRRISGANLARNATIVPHVTNFDDADVTELEAFRSTVNSEQQAGGAKLTMLAFLIKASVAALRRHPTFNASLDGDALVLKRYFHIGFAADTPNGLLVPVIRDADRKGLIDIAAEAAELAARARAGTLKAAEMQGGCFTISSLGGIGGNGFTPIINAPEVAILGAAKAKIQPVWDGKAFAPRLIMPICMSWDHRVVDGAEAARFLVTLTALLGDFRRIAL